MKFVSVRPSPLLSIALALAACGGDPADTADTDLSTTTPSTTAPTTGDPPADTTDPTTDPTSTSTTDTSTTEDPTTDPPATSTTDPTATTDPTDTGGPGLACPLVDGPGVAQLALSPVLLGDGADADASPSCADLNPERGFHEFVDLRDLDADTLADITAAGNTLIYGQILIPEYRDIPLDDVVLDEVAAGFDLVRDHGMKVVPRFHYSNDGDEPDAELDRILGHIDQIAPLLQQHADVIFVLQAGFIGAWGEWHSSQNGLDDPGPRKQILDALLAALPVERSVVVRRPSFKQDAYGGPVTAADAHDGSDRARVGHVNDCFLASDSDEGTYQEPGEKDYAIADSAFVPVGGETCAVNPPRSECPTALAELALLHWSHLNADYHPDVLAAWQQDGCYDEIACRLGYRLAVTGLRWAAAAAPGGALPVALDLVNDGFAAPVNARPAVLVLDGPSRIELTIDTLDIRTLQPGAPQTACVDAPIPADAPPGMYRLGLRLADPAPTLADDPRQAIHLANDAEVEFQGGINWFAAMVPVQ